MENQSSITEMISESLDRIRAVIDADTVVGKQIQTPSGTVIIPISKVSMGFASGGLDLPRGKCEGSAKSFGGGGGTGVTVSPIGFLTVYADGHVEMLNINNEKPSPVEQLADILENAPAFISRVKGFFDGRSTDGDEDEEADTEAAEEDYEARIAEEIMEEDKTELSYREMKKLMKKKKKEAAKK